MVAPFAGAWIEIKWYISICNLYRVAPFAGAWIEIDRQERGRIYDYAVAPFAGAWIEIG